VSLAVSRSVVSVCAVCSVVIVCVLLSVLLACLLCCLFVCLLTDLCVYSVSRPATLHMLHCLCLLPCVCVQLGFDRAAERVFANLARAVQTSTDAGRVRELPALNVPQRNREMRASPALFQLTCMGPDMPRNVGSTDDDRVPFRPDNWQKQCVVCTLHLPVCVMLCVLNARSCPCARPLMNVALSRSRGNAVVAAAVCRLLDLVDQKRSALVIAPTSSGKTFISYYIMKLVLEERSTPTEPEPGYRYPGVVLYVCPTKQLANQVRSERPGQNVVRFALRCCFRRRVVGIAVVAARGDVADTWCLCGGASVVSCH
jgi:hypothetical protein